LTQTQIDTSFLEANCTTTNVLHRTIKKRPFAKVLADIPPLESVVFEPIDLGPEPDREPQIRLPEDIDPNDPYALFSLFWPGIYGRLPLVIQIYIRYKKGSANYYPSIQGLGVIR
jgi:hypothetical protein